MRNPDKRAFQLLAMANAVGEAIRDLGGVPSGHLYAHLCGHMTLDEYQFILGILKDGGLVREDAHFLTWVGSTDVGQPITRG